MTILSRTELNAGEFLRHSRRILEHFERCADNAKGVMTDEEQQVAIDALEDACGKYNRRCTGWKRPCTRG